MKSPMGENCLSTTIFKGEIKATKKQISYASQPVITAGFRGIYNACLKVTENGHTLFLQKKILEKNFTLK